MEYRELGRTGLSVSAIGLGTEFLLDQPRDTVVAVIREAIDRGVNYFDAFWAQPAFRDDLGAAFQGRRTRVLLTAHLGSTCQEDGQYAITRDPQIAEPFFLDFLRRLNTDHVDVLFLHNCNSQKDYAALMDPGGLLGLARRLQQEGRARFIGLSGHNTVTSRQAVESGAIDVLMFPVNLACRPVPGFFELLGACVAHEVGLVAMKPFGGGSLLRQEHILHVQDFQMGRTETRGAPMRFEKKMTITPLQCLAFVLTQEAVSTTVPGCQSVPELAEALSYWQAGTEALDFSAILPAFDTLRSGQCVYCNHCLPCPAEIDIGKVIRLLDEAQGELTAELQAQYEALPVEAAACLACGDCEERCPFGVAVAERMEQAAALFAGRCVAPGLAT